jgi:serine/threonine-protein kinase
MATSPASGKTVDYGSTVQVIVSKGPDLVPVPNLLRRLFGGAFDALTASGLQGQVQGPIAVNKPVRGQAPVAGTMVPRGSTVVFKF